VLDRDRVPILLYHGISRPGAQDAFSVALSDFEAHMDVLASSGRRPQTISELTAPLARGGGMASQGAAVTFDDGTADFYEHAFPVLRERGLTATLYVVSGLVGKRYRGAPMLTWHQLQEVRDAGIEIGAHGHRHIQLDLLPLERAARELLDSKRVLEARLQSPVKSFAYPFGYHTAAVKRLVPLAGYTSACAVKNRLSYPRDDPFALARLTIDADTSAPCVDRLLQGRGAGKAWRGDRMRTRAWRLYRQHQGAVRGLVRER
jgi:peptidoglycan/xylan/chitin deacetylase (PgdA/CDA1 family)